MAFDIEQWKTQAAIRFQKLQYGLNRESAAQLYAFLSVTALWPVLEAVQRGDWSAVITLTSLTAANLGTNLLANQIQSWKDESSAVQQVNEAVQHDPELRAELDLILSRLEAIPTAEKAIGEADRTWFAETLKHELETIHSGITYTATVIGGGVAAQGNGAIALGKGATLIQGGLYGDYIPSGGSKIVIPDPETEKRQKALETYLTRLARACLALPLAAMGGDESAESDVTLDRVYIELNTTSRKDGKQVSADDEVIDQMRNIDNEDKKNGRLSALEAAGQSTRLALIGDPGAGKSTFVKKLLAWQANARLGKTSPPEGFSASLLPVLIILRDLAPRLAAILVDNLPAPRRDELLTGVVWDQIAADLGAECENFAPGLQEALQTGDCLLVLDGLDEVPHDLRARVRQAVDALLKRYKLQRIIVTCRVRSYVGEAVLPQFTSRTLAPFTQAQIGRFVEGWYNTQRELGRITELQAKERITDLTNAANQTDLRELSSNPMLLTTMAIIHQREVGLPRERVRLYSLAVEILLRRWQKHKVGDAALADFLKNDLKLRAVMERLAYAAHRASTESGASGTLLRKDIIELLENVEYLGSLQLAGEFLDYVDQRAGLLVGYGGELNKPTSYSFPHRTFQEYLAGAYLAGQRDRVRTFMQHAAEGDSWDLAAQLAFEELFYNRRGANELLDLAYQLGGAFRPGAQNERAFLWAGQITALVGRDAVERDCHPSGGPAYLQKLLPGLVNLFGSSLQPLERAEAGRALAKLGDPRPEVLTCGQMAFCHVPAGEFIYGDGKGKKISLDEYWIGKYLVTNAQFTQFVEAGGYQNPAYWPEAIKEQYWTKAGFKGRYDNKPRMSPYNFGEPFMFSNHPVVGVTWYEALAFTRWLSEQLVGNSAKLSITGESGRLLDGLKTGKYQAVLPDEKQWEKAARGTDGREYPWGKGADPNRANYDETGIGTTSAVGAFPGGQSPYGILDVSGNVWEWTASPYDTASYVLRGGAFNNQSDFARCAFRGWGAPDDRDSYLGFRVMVGSVFSRASL